MANESTLSTFVASDGENIAVQDWPLEPGVRPRALVLLVHGLGEHAGRYEHVAQRLNAWGFAVRGYDQYGHGESGGVRGGLPSDERLLDDLADMVDAYRARMSTAKGRPKQARTAAREGKGTSETSDIPLILLGHSLGGLVAARFVSLKLRPVQGLVLSSPALDAGLTAFQKALLAVVLRIAPDFRASNGLDVRAISRSPATVAAYCADKLAHDRVSGRMGRFIAQHGPATLGLATTWTVPTLLMYAGADKLVNPAASRAFAQSAPHEVVSAHCFEGLYHEIFNEVDAEPVFARLQAWLDERV